MKKIGFVDFYLQNWHADNYPAWIREANETLGTDFTPAYAWAEKENFTNFPFTADQWCEKNGVERCKTLEELCEKSDVIVVLAPSDPEKHPEYAKTVLKYGKRTYIDKTFAPDYASAKMIFDLGEKYGTPFFSTSALRYATELADVKEPRTLFLEGNGRIFGEYSIHLIEMCVLTVNSPAKQVRTECFGEQRLCRCRHENGAETVIIFSPRLPYRVVWEGADGISRKVDITSDFFKGLIADILRFFDTGTLPFDTAQTLEVIRLRDALLKGENNDGQWIDV